MKRRCLLVGFLLFASLVHGELPAKINYTDHVLPIFKNACLNCHNPDKKKAGLDLSTFQSAIQGSENGKVLNPGDPGGSQLLKCVMQTDDPKMPPKGDKLSDTDIGMIKKWIEDQLLETSGSKALAPMQKALPAVVVSLQKPEGPPPMPGDLPIEPAVRTLTVNSLTALGASPWAPLVALGGQKQIVLYHTGTLELLGVLPFPEGFPTIIKFSREGSLILTGGGLGGKSGKVVIWDVRTGERVTTIGNEFDQVLAADLSADHQLVALGGPNKLVKIYSTRDGKLLHSIKKHTDWVTALAFSPDGKLLASADRSGGVIVWESDKAQEFCTLPGHKGMVTGLAFMTGVVATGSEDATIKLWDVKEAKEIRSWKAHEGGVQSVDFTPDGRLVSSGRDKIARVWDQDGKQLSASEPFAEIALRAELAGDRLIAGDWKGQVRVCSFPEGKMLGELSPNPPLIGERLAEATRRLREAQETAKSAQEQKQQLEEKANRQKIAIEQIAQQIAREKQNLLGEQSTLDASKTALETAQAALKSTAKPPDAAASVSAAPVNSASEIEAAKNKVTSLQALADAATKALAARKIQIGVLEAELTKQTAANDLQKLANAKSASDAASARVAQAQAEIDRWETAQCATFAFRARRELAEKQVHLAELQAAVRDASRSAERAEKGAAESAKSAQELMQKVAAQTARISVSKLAATSAKEAEATAEKTSQSATAALQALPVSTSPESMATAKSEAERSKTALGAAQREAKNAEEKAFLEEKTLADLQRKAEAAQKESVKLRAAANEVVRTAPAQEKAAEQVLAAFLSEIEIAKRAAEKRQSEYEARKGSPRSTTAGLR